MLDVFDEFGSFGQNYFEEEEPVTVKKAKWEKVNLIKEEENIVKEEIHEPSKSDLASKLELASIKERKYQFQLCTNFAGFAWAAWHFT